MKCSVVICAFTDERWDDVHAAVESVRRQRHAPHEIIVSVDHNRDLYVRLKASLPDVIVVENRHGRGLSGGKNTGFELAAGDIVAYLDDDAVAAPGWLAALAAGYADRDVIGVGGRTLPLWPGSPSSAELARDHAAIVAELAAAPAEVGRRPRWFPEEFDWTVGCTYRGMVPGPIRNLMGGNCSFRAEAFEIAGGFTTGIGRSVGKRPLGCEETEFCIRLGRRRPDSVLLFDDRAVIWHRVPATRARFGYLRARCYAEGLSKALVTRSVGAGDGLASERAHVLKTLPRGVLRGLATAGRGDVGGLGRAGAIVTGLSVTAWGYLVGSLTAAAPAAPAGLAAPAADTAVAPGGVEVTR
ncbi:MAG TPA: glycosyltransferase [Streptosporangiaceae bacterium]|jgi:glycosyltransferase involved in cell wall biosynthesis|nr:glycosyltransferase [Streptosporangiaceae bacterium]